MPDIFNKKLLLLTQEVTLTIVTNPSGATCTLTYDGNSYNAKTITVPSGSTVGYSVYHSTYGTSTGTVVMSTNKTLTFTGSYTTSQTEQAWSIPTVSSDQTPGGSVFAPFADSIYPGRYAYLAFDGQTGTGHIWQSGSTMPHYLGFYNPNAVKITSITFNFLKQSSASYSPQNGSLQASNDGSNYTTLDTFSYSANPQTVSFSNPTSNYYKYYRIYGTDGGRSGMYAVETVTGSGTTVVQSYTYYWDIS